MATGFRRWWPLLKSIVLVVVMLGVGWHLVRLMENEEVARTDEARTPAEILWDETCSASTAGLVLSAALYLVAFGCSASYWIWLTRKEGDVLPTLPGFRAFFISQLGKYVPGKGCALLMRTAMATEAGCRPGAAVLTAIYETLSTMAAGAMVAAVLLLFLGGDDGLIWKAIALVVLAGVPVLPGVFNRVVDRITARFRRAGMAELPRPSNRALLGGLLLAACGWFILGASLQSLLGAMGAEVTPGLHGWLHSTSIIAVSYVAGFIASTPGGLGVREYLLAQMLAPQLGPRSVVAAILLRLLWTVAEVVIAFVLWWFARRGRQEVERTSPAREPREEPAQSPVPS